MADLEDPFIGRILKERRLELVPGPRLPDDLTDADFLKYWQENPEDAVEHFNLLAEKPTPIPALPKKGSK